MKPRQQQRRARRYERALNTKSDNHQQTTTGQHNNGSDPLAPFEQRVMELAQLAEAEARKLAMMRDQRRQIDTEIADSERTLSALNERADEGRTWLGNLRRARAPVPPPAPPRRDESAAGGLPNSPESPAVGPANSSSVQDATDKVS